MEKITCNFCKRDNASPVYTLTDIRMGLPGEFNLVKCKYCGLLYLNPQPTWEELIPHYSNGYHCYYSAPKEQASHLVRWTQQYGLQRRCQAITKFIPSGRLLDVGCATGLFLDEMRRNGDWQVLGVEPVESAAEYARNHFGLEIFQGILTEANFPSLFFDVVTLWDVLEHTPNPHATLLEIHRILKSDGLIVIKVPDPESKEAKLFGPSWVGYEAPQHLYGFTQAVLTTQLEKMGFTDIKVDSLGSDYSVFMTSLNGWLNNHEYMRLGKLTKVFAKSTIARLVLSPFFLSLRKLGIRSSKVYFARKR